MIRVTLVSDTDAYFGAAIATQRIHNCLLNHGRGLGIDSQLRVIQSRSPLSAMSSGPPFPRSRYKRLAEKLWTQLRHTPYLQGFSSLNKTYHSVAWNTTGLGSELNLSKADLINLHWLGGDTISIQEIGNLRQPVVWTLHDQWAFCGAEHYVNLPPEHDERFAEGYSSTNRPSGERGPDLNRHVWQIKQRAWKKAIHIICPSKWLADCARRSVLMRTWPVHVVPNPIDLERFVPCDQAFVRQSLGLPLDPPLILFGAYGGTADPRKGADLMLQSLALLHREADLGSLEDLQLVVLGESSPSERTELGFPVHYAGRIDDDAELRRYYTAADLMVIPSRLDNLPNTAIEAHACGTPVVAFRTGGLQDIVEDRTTGALAEPFSVESLAEAIRWVLEDRLRNRQLGVAARRRAECFWAPDRIASLYAAIYAEALETQPPQQP